MSRETPNDAPAVTWLPNFVGGRSIWQQAAALNAVELLDGRLLVPAAPTGGTARGVLRWPIADLLPLPEARVAFPADVEAALADFLAALARLATALAKDGGELEPCRSAFTLPALPALQGDGATHYFYSPEHKKLFVADWGASPPLGTSAKVLGLDAWRREHAAAPGVDPPRHEEARRRGWWTWPLLALLSIAAGLLTLVVLKSCAANARMAGAASDAAGGSPAASLAQSPIVGDSLGRAAAAGDGEASELHEGGRPRGLGIDGVGADDATDASSDVTSPSGDVGDDGASAIALPSTDGAASVHADADEPVTAASLDGESAAKSDSVVVIGPAGNADASVAIGTGRRHFQEGAVAWRVSSGYDKVARTDARGRTFDVWLGPDRTFNGVNVEWRDRGGKWHAH